MQPLRRRRDYGECFDCSEDERLREAAGWKKLPKGWTQESVKSFWAKLTGDRKHKVTACHKKMKDKFGDKGAWGFCASLADMVEGTTKWRGKDKGEKAMDDILVAGELIRLAKELTSRKKHTMKETITTKKGTTLEKGEDVTLSWKKNNPVFVSITTSDGRRMLTQSKNLHERVTGVAKSPSMNSLEKWMFDGVAKSVYGKRVEPDGWDSSGSPSWFLALGYI